MFKRLAHYCRSGIGKFNRIAEDGAQNAHRLRELSSQVEQLQREMRLLLSYLSRPTVDLWPPKRDGLDGAPAAMAFANASMCRQDSFEQPYFPYWARKIGVGLNYHRKVWEYVFICQALWERGALAAGAKALGFGVGREPLTAFFASESCDVTATDATAEMASALGWAESSQHAVGVEALRYEHICRREQFDRHVSFQACDMNHVQQDLTGFDFCWSACALEHLGSIEHGLRFIERSVDCLKPGGWAVHTTEFNVSSNDATVDRSGTVLFRRRDLEDVAERLTRKGHQVAPFDFDPGRAPLDEYIDVAPYRSEPHLKLAIGGYAATSIGIIVRRRP
jgi:2-polyprenyl-3-methyl-5-hydroxy-6-metoxy-1,4-benzoquinol methylase